MGVYFISWWANYFIAGLSLDDWMLSISMSLVKQLVYLWKLIIIFKLKVNLNEDYLVDDELRMALIIGTQVFPVFTFPVRKICKRFLSSRRDF